MNIANDGAATSIVRLARGYKQLNTVRGTGHGLTPPVKTLDRAPADAGVDPENNVLAYGTKGDEILCLNGSPQAAVPARFIEAKISTKPVYESGVLLSELEAWMGMQGFQRTMVRRSLMNVLFRKAG